MNIRLRHLLSFGLFFLLVATSGANIDLQTSVAEDYDYLRQLYEHLHSHPEISLQEKNTSARIAQELRQIGFEVTEDVGGYGVVALLRNGEGPTLMVRTDMDALPVREQTGLAYRSNVNVLNAAGERVPVMHACGHDVHMTVLVGTARQLIQQTSQWQGTLMLIAEPAEEIGAGARAMLADGLFKRFPRPDYNLAMHVSADLPAGRIGYVEGFSMANVDSVDILVRGIGGHGAYPHKTKDPVLMAAEIVLLLQTIISREMSPLESAVITVGSIHGGTKHNIIGDEVKLELTVRSYADSTRDFLLQRIRDISRGVARTAGIAEDLLPIITIKDEYTPSVYNEPAFVQKIVGHLRQILGKNRLVAVPPVMAGEDFSRYGRTQPAIPSALLWLGAVDPDVYGKARQGGTALPSLHSAKFAPLPEPTIKTGVTAMTSTAMYLLGKGK